MFRHSKRIFIIFCVAILLAVEYAFGDLFLDSKTQLVTPFTKVLIVLTVGSLTAILISDVVRRRITSDAPGGGSGTARASRLQSVAALITGILWGLTVLMVALVVISQAGVDLGPLLAGAGIVGVVVGLGSQNLLNDVLAGIFYVIDDAFRIGEYVEIGTLRGTVERISLRSMQVRHHRGALHTIPYGKMASVSNYSRDWVIVKFQFQLPLDTDVLKVKRIVKDVSASFMEQEEFAPFILEPLKFQGIDDVDLFGLMVRLKFMAVPGEQFVMRREMLRRLQTAFADNNIEFAKRSVTVNTVNPLHAAVDGDDDPITAAGSTTSDSML
ncbi:MAG: mechanosensitive ion channel family protein [Alphaproteobacteria bacterium]|nr:mechanosensitive ion channel family protein [Alphaproteobacteria bacterium]